MIIISVYIFVLQQDLIKHKISLNINFEYYSPISSKLCADDTNDTSILSNLQEDVQATGLPLFTPIYSLIMFLAPCSATLKSMRLEFRINCINCINWQWQSSRLYPRHHLSPHSIILPVLHSAAGQKRKRLASVCGLGVTPLHRNHQF